MYNPIAYEYQTVVRDTRLPLAKPERYTFAQLIGDVRGKSILDFGCGEGVYARQLRQMGAARVVGLDLSDQMIALAQQAEAQAPLGIEYLVADARSVGRIGDFDRVVSFFMLNHAQTRDELRRMCQSIAANLKPGGAFFAFNNNLELPPAAYPFMEKYGRRQSVPGPLVEGTPITITIRVGDEDCTFVDCYLSRATYEWAFQAAGIHPLAWSSPQVAPEDLQRDGQEYWQNFLDYPTFVVIKAQKHGQDT